jgi:DNA-binding response OmpR family regulator
MARVLIVDDDRDMVEASRMVLQSEGHTVQVAYSAGEGKQAVKETNPDILLLDVMMDQPDDGIALAQDLRRDGFAGAILMLSSISKVAGQKYGKDAELLPVDDFQEKPIDPSVLVAKVAELLKGKES